MTTTDWNVKVYPEISSFGLIYGPELRLDTKITRLTNTPTHGIMGQSFVQSRREGKRDKYLQHGEYTTTAQGEGAIDGVANDYEVKDSFSYDFKYSLFTNDAKHYQKLSNEFTVSTISDDVPLDVLG